MRVGSHSNIELLAARLIRVPDDPPPAVGRQSAGQTGHLHLEHKVACTRWLTDRDVVDRERSGRLTLRSLFRMARRSLLNNHAGAPVANKRRSNFIVPAGGTDRIYSQYFIIIRFGRVGSR